MIPIVLTVLKGIGIVLLALFLCCLFLLCLILFAPIRYRVHGKKDIEWNVRGNISWCLHLIHISFVLQKDGEHHKLRVLGIPILSSDKKKKSSKKRKKQSNSGKNNIDSSEPNAENKKGSSFPDIKKIDGEEDEKKKEEKTSWDSVNAASEKNVEDALVTKPDETKKRGFVFKIRSCLEEIRKKIKGFFRKIQKIFLSCKSRFDKMKKEEKHESMISQIKKFIREENTRQFIRSVWKYWKILWRNIHPRRCKGYLHFGTGDPCSTGEILGAASVFYGMYGKHFQVIPEFKEEVLEGEIWIRGRVQIVVVLYVALRIYFSSEYKKFMQDLKKIRKGGKTQAE